MSIKKHIEALRANAAMANMDIDGELLALRAGREAWKQLAISERDGIREQTYLALRPNHLIGVMISGDVTPSALDRLKERSVVVDFDSLFKPLVETLIVSLGENRRYTTVQSQILRAYSGQILSAIGINNWYPPEGLAYDLPLPDVESVRKIIRTYLIAAFKSPVYANALLKTRVLDTLSQVDLSNFNVTAIPCAIVGASEEEQKALAPDFAKVYSVDISGVEGDDNFHSFFSDLINSQKKSKIEKVEKQKNSE